ncbi:MAG: glycine--tRNA ligase subunit beta [Elusimicrobiota bacterium]
MKKSNVLFELTVENIPARFVISAKKQLKENIFKLLKDWRLEFGEINVYATYRRLVVFIKDVARETPKIIEKVYGPPAKILKDGNGNYTAAAIGFANKVGVKTEELKVENVDKKGEVICAYKTIPSKDAIKILSSVFSEAVKMLDFPKNMIWEDTKFVFARPIRNIVALYGSKTIPVDIAGVKSSRSTYAAYFYGFKKIHIKHADEYMKLLEKNYLIINDTKRKETILKIIDGVETAMKATIKKDEDLIDENLYLCEYPSGVVVKFPSEFLKLPKELLVLVMKKQLKFFSCEDKKGNILPFFLGIRDGISRGHRNVEEGYLNVFKARCADAVFFYETDLKSDLRVFEEKLKNLMFQKELGTMYEKGERVKKVVGYLMNKLNLNKRELLESASYIYYDLVSNVVGEFTELEGIMNYYYAPKYGIKDEEIRRAISEIYMPTGFETPIPENIYGSVLAISHKIDTLVGNFILGIIPVSGNDPYALRRTANGIFRIINENNISLNLHNLIEFSYNTYGDEIKKKKKLETLKAELLEFIYQRIENFCLSKQITQDVINSVKNVFISEGDIIKSLKRIEILSTMKSKGEFEVIALLYKRLKNIIKDFKGEDLDISLFEKEEEKRIYEISQKLKPLIKDLCNKGEYLNAIGELMKISSELEDFFKNVMVMSENEKIKENRLSLLKKIYNLFLDVADISQIVY